jgi:predicted XRE-type DNA-binding protein
MRKLKNNLDITKKAAQCGVFYWQIAEYLGIADTTFSRKMRKPLDEATRTKIITFLDTKKGA